MLQSEIARHRASRVETLLDKERRMILAGEFDGLPALVAERDAALERLASAPGVTKQALRGAVERIAVRATRNARLLEAAIEGVSAARSRLRLLADAADRLGVYTEKGGRLDRPRAGGPGRRA